jgi:hypothetical protein
MKLNITTTFLNTANLTKLKHGNLSFFKDGIDYIHYLIFLFEVHIFCVLFAILSNIGIVVI